MLVYLQSVDAPKQRSKFELLHEHYKGLMYYIAYGILHNQQDAEEAVSISAEGGSMRRRRQPFMTWAGGVMMRPADL